MGAYHRPLNDFPRRLPRKKWLAEFGTFIGRLVIPLRFKTKVSGLENIPPNGGVVIAAKHQRWEDIPLLALALPMDLYYIAKAELFRSPAMGWMMSALGGVSLNRKRPIESRESLRLIDEILSRRAGLVLFPEGTYFRERMGKGRAGVLKFISTRYGVPFLPVGIEYRKGILRTSVSIRIGRPFADIGQSAPDSLLHKIMDDIASLSGLS
jgi:1-acyl-sn-glycerol-3-phosphate acyltransferase